MSRPRFSIVVPTRERADTLRFALRTCVAQQFDSFEVVVCDNGDSSAARQVVDDLDTRLIKYVRAPQGLAMSHNWELAVSHAAGEFVTVIGDDDGLALDALSEADRLIARHRARVLRWEWLEYHWPDLPFAPNILVVPLNRVSGIVSGPETIKAVIDWKKNYRALPMIYNSFIHRDLIQDLRQRTGCVFRGISPDIYSGFAFASMAGSFYSSGRHLGICGISGKSNGYSGGDPESFVARDFRALNSSANLTWHPRIPQMNNFEAVALESYQRAKDALFPHDAELELDARLFVERCMHWLSFTAEKEREHYLQVLREVFVRPNNLEAWFESEVLCRSSHEIPGLTAHWASLAHQTDLVLHEVNTLGIADVHGAARLYERLLQLCGHQMPILNVLLSNSESRHVALQALCGAPAD